VLIFHQEKNPYFIHTAKWRSKIIVGALNIILHFAEILKIGIFYENNLNA
jgi:hypothetical protein